MISLLAFSSPAAAQSLPGDDECSANGIVTDSFTDELTSAPNDPGFGTALNLVESTADNCADGEVDEDQGFLEKEVDKTIEEVDSFLNPDADDIKFVDDVPECGEDFLCA